MLIVGVLILYAFILFGGPIIDLISKSITASTIAVAVIVIVGLYSLLRAKH
jgi:hypothetical protein